MTLTDKQLTEIQAGFEVRGIHEELAYCGPTRRSLHFQMSYGLGGKVARALLKKLDPTKANPRKRRRARLAMELILFNAWRAVQLGRIYPGYQIVVKYSRARSFYKRERRYGLQHLSYRTFIRTIDAMERLGFIKQEISRPGSLYRTFYWPTREVIDHLEEHELELCRKSYNPELVILRDKNKELVDYEDTKQTRSMRTQIRSLNTVNATHEFTLEIPTRDITRVRQSEERENRSVADKTEITITIGSEDYQLTTTKQTVEELTRSSTSRPNYKETNTTNIRRRHGTEVSAHNTTHKQQEKEPEDTKKEKDTHQQERARRREGAPEPRNLTQREHNQTGARAPYITEDEPEGTPPRKEEENPTLEEIHPTSTRIIHGVNGTGIVSILQGISCEIDREKMTLRIPLGSLTRYVRIFNRDFLSGGRYYAHIQNVPSDLRQYLRIDQEATCELDYSALHPHLLYGRLGIPLEGDPYAVQIDGWRDLARLRTAIKKAVLIFINASDEQTAMKAVNWQIRLGKIPVEKGFRAKHLLAAVKKAHPRLEPYFCSGVGPQLQYADACLAEKITREFLKYKKPLISIHDGFCTKYDDMDLLHHAMETAFKSATDFRPNIKIVRGDGQSPP